jgi:glycogen(starch) synthase
VTRVLVVSWEYPPLVEGGLARHVGRLSEELVAQGHEVHVLTRGGAELPPAAVRDGVHVHRVAASRTPWDLDAFLAWIEELNAELLAAGRALGGPFDVVHGHDWVVGRAADGLAHALGVPLVMTFHATEHGRHEGRVAHHPQDTIHAAERRIARRADAVIVCSEFMRAHVTEVFDLPRERVRAIPNGIDAAAPRRLPAAPGAAPGRGRLVLLVGRLVYEKGFQVALEALPPSSPRCPARASPSRAPARTRPSCASAPPRSA